MTRNRLLLAVPLLALVPVAARAQTSYPMVTRVEPAAVQRGTSTEISITGNGTGNTGGDFSGAWSMLCQVPGLQGEVLSVEKPEPPAAKAKAKGKGRGTRRASS